MRILFAPWVAPISKSPIANGIVVVDDKNRIDSIVAPTDDAYPTLLEKAEKYSGVLCPGFVNAHCHTELSYLQNKVPANSGGLVGFIKNLQGQRSFTTEATDEIAAAITASEDEMLQNGIVAVGDICNHPYSFAQKAKGRLLYYTFIEQYGLDPDKVDEYFDTAKALLQRYEAANPTAPASIAPHATYSVSLPLLRKIAEYNYLNDGVISIHNQETPSEDAFFTDNTGDIAQLMQQFGPVRQPTGFSALQSNVVHLPNCNRIILVHNTYTSPKDVAWAADYGKLIFWCLCPNANLYIENALPDIALLHSQANHRIVVGTDSLASNTGLSILAELKTIAQHYPKIPFADMLTWATYNGAYALGFAGKIGTFDKGKTPGINLISLPENGELTLTAEASIVKVV